MAVRRILLFPSSVLSTTTARVNDFGTSLEHLIEDLRDTLLASPGVGLAAPQIGVLRRVAVVDVSRSRSVRAKNSLKSHGFLVLINPSLVEGNGLQIPREGCLSLPDFLGNVQRFQSVKVRYFAQDGTPTEIESEAFEALALQHELDHLDGKLFIDRVANIKTDVFRRKN